MFSFLREKSTEAGKLFAGILIFGIVGKWDFLPKDYWGGELLKVALDATVSCLVVIFVTDILLGVPIIAVEWRTHSRDRELSGDIPIHTDKQVLNLQIKSGRETLLQRILLAQSKHRNFKIEIQLISDGVVKLSRQGGSDSFRCQGETLTFEGIHIEGESTVGFADFTLRRREISDYSHEVRLKIRACWEPRILRLPFKIARINSGIERFILEGRNGGDTN